MFVSRAQTGEIRVTGEHVSRVCSEIGRVTFSLRTLQPFVDRSTMVKVYYYSYVSP